MANARILVVEDESIVAMGIKHKLETMGHTVVEMVASGENAVRAAEEHVPDIILMDIVIKGDMDGIEAAHAIHEYHDIPIIYLTAYADEEMLMRARVTQPYGYIIKPFKSTELNANIQMALFKHKAAKKEKEIIKKQILDNFHNFIVQAIPTSGSQSEMEMRDMLFNAFGERLEEDMKPSFEYKMEEFGISEDTEDGQDIFDSYLAWLSEIFSDFGIRVGIIEKSPRWYFEFDNCPWKEEAKNNPIFCINCQAIINRSFDWTNLEGSVKRKSTIASGSDSCIFTFNL
ncbi:MAG: methanogen output domain 1-containing protein [Methanobacteriaceae archaeon]|nr:methanogen output domain 1-containing protein [Methanobacteriaceae archaeon]MDP2835767.1 methanogen output domain 1-containing protein [Methanobacteriaceae archaeon]MDP3034994.1 methanogen output domain 1-containing protein [Methanobacteriaceae archaeon]MDP3484314.1 methanogen output domain 1-containing protein [Methanobacteriaceae archaeon]